MLDGLSEHRSTPMSRRLWRTHRIDRSEATCLRRPLAFVGFTGLAFCASNLFATRVRTQIPSAAHSPEQHKAAENQEHCQDGHSLISSVGREIGVRHGSREAGRRRGNGTGGGLHGWPAFPKRCVRAAWLPGSEGSTGITRAHHVSDLRCEDRSLMGPRFAAISISACLDATLCCAVSEFRS